MHVSMISAFVFTSLSLCVYAWTRVCARVFTCVCRSAGAGASYLLQQSVFMLRLLVTRSPPLDKFPCLARPQLPETQTLAKHGGKSATTRLNTPVAGQPSHIRAASASPRIERLSAWCEAPPQAPLPSSGGTSSVTLSCTRLESQQSQTNASSSPIAAAAAALSRAS